MVNSYIGNNGAFVSEKMSSFEQVAEFSQIPAVATINFYERVYKNVKDFCEGSTDSDVPIRTGIRLVKI